MVKWTTLLIIAAIIIIAGIGLRIVIKPSDSSAQTQLNMRSAVNASTEIKEGIIELPIRNYTFEPVEIKIKAGSKITWVNYDKSPHRVISDSGGISEINSEILDTGVSYGHVFNKPGVYNYHCSINTEMKGRVIVV